MKIIRYRDAQGTIGYAAQESENVFRRATGDLAHGWQATKEMAAVHKILAPVEPAGPLAHRARRAVEVRPGAGPVLLAEEDQSRHVV